MKDMMIGVDLAKRVFQVHGALSNGEVQFRKKLTRQQFRVFLEKQAPSLVIFEACSSASYWCHRLTPPEILLFQLECFTSVVPKTGHRDKMVSRPTNAVRVRLTCTALRIRDV